MGSEVILRKSAISEFHALGKIRWDFNIDDTKLQDEGFEMKKDDLPTVDFEFIGDSIDPQSPPTPPPDRMDIAITSFWKITPPDEPKGTWIRKLLHIVKPTTSSKGHNHASAPTFFSNLFQIIAFETDLSKLVGPCYYKADVTVNPGATNPHHEVKISKEAKPLFNAIPAVVNG